VVPAHPGEAGGSGFRRLAITEAVGGDGRRASTCLRLRSEY